MHARAKISKPPKRQGRKMPQTRYSSQDRFSNFEKNNEKCCRNCGFARMQAQKIRKQKNHVFFLNTILRCPTHRRESLRNAGLKHEKHQNMGNNPRQNQAPWPPTTTTTTMTVITTVPFFVSKALEILGYFSPT